MTQSDREIKRALPPNVQVLARMMQERHRAQHDHERQRDKPSARQLLPPAGSAQQREQEHRRKRQQEALQGDGQAHDHAEEQQPGGSQSGTVRLERCQTGREQQRRDEQCEM